jgi:hypothetical protein
MNTNTLVGRWESERGAHVVELHKADGTGYRYIGQGCGGYLSATNGPDALAEMQARVDSGFFLPDASVRPMRRAYPAAGRPVRIRDTVGAALVDALALSAFHEEAVSAFEMLDEDGNRWGFAAVLQAEEASFHPDALGRLLGTVTHADSL